MMPGGRESAHRAQDLHCGLRAGYVHSQGTSGCTSSLALREGLGAAHQPSTMQVRKCYSSPGQRAGTGGCQWGGTETQDCHSTDPSPACLGQGRCHESWGWSCSRAIPNPTHTAAAEDHPAAGCQGSTQVHGEGWAPLLSRSRLRCATLILSTRWNMVQGTSPGLQVWFQHCYRLSKAAPTAPTAASHPCFHFEGRSQLRADIWSCCLVTSLQTAAAIATSKPIHSSVSGSAVILRHGRHRCEHRHMYVLTHAFTPQESE